MRKMHAVFFSTLANFAWKNAIQNLSNFVPVSLLTVN